MDPQVPEVVDTRYESSSIDSHLLESMFPYSSRFGLHALIFNNRQASPSFYTV